jgi:hypothetical protein
VTCSLPDPENECQQSVNSFICGIFGNHGIAWNFAFITELWTALRGTYTIFEMYNTDSKLIDIARCTACKNIILVAANAILVQYY